MKFKAHIKLTEEQSVEAMRWGADDTEYADVEFNLWDLAYCVSNAEAPFSFRELLVPWLLAGNEPEIVSIDRHQTASVMKAVIDCQAEEQMQDYLLEEINRNLNNSNGEPGDVR